MEIVSWDTMKKAAKDGAESGQKSEHTYSALHCSTERFIHNKNVYDRLPHVRHVLPKNGSPYHVLETSSSPQSKMVNLIWNLRQPIVCLVLLVLDHRCSAVCRLISCMSI
jgi:hypothetical protein